MIMKLLSLFFLVVCALTFAKEPSSEIPKRREFPLDPKINPCEDFYGYVCNPVVSSFKLRDDRFFHDFAFHDSSERILESKTEFIHSLPKRKGLSRRAKNISTVYSACMDVEGSKKEEKKIVSSLVGQMGRIKTMAQLQLFFVEQMRKGDEYSPIDFGTVANQKNPKKEDLFFLSDMLTLPERTYYDKDEVVLDLVQLVKGMLEELHEPNPQERAESVVQFERDAAKTYLLPVEQRDRFSMETGITKAEFTKKWPHFKFDKFFPEVPGDTHIRNLSPENFDWVNQSFDKVPLNVIKDAYLFRALPRYMDDAYPAFFARHFDFNKKHLGGPDVRPKREERCTRFVMEHLGMELDAELIPELFPKFPTERVVEIAEKVRQSIVSSIQDNNWLSLTAKETAKNKMKSARLQLVKPTKDADWDFALPANYDPHAPYTNTKTLLRNAQKKELQRLKKPRNENEWSMTPLTVNAYYSQSDNKFVLPIGILQYPFFDSSISAEAAFGAMGSVVGHELGHGIDDKGARYDANGKLFQWMSDKDLEQFTSLGKKLVKQLDDKGFPGALKLGEFMGDLTGVSLSYKAAFPVGAVQSDKKKDFFLQYARVWCYVGRPKHMEMRAKTNPHPPGEVRTNDVLKHVDAFHEAFQCKSGDKMYLSPEDRVRIW